MFEDVVSYDAAYVGAFPATAEEYLPTVLRWAASELEERDLGADGLTVVAPTRDQFSRSGPLAGLPSGLKQETWKTMRSLTPIVVAAWPSAKALESIEEHRGQMEAMCVLPWGSESEIQIWATARNAWDLLGQRPTAGAPTIGDPVVGEAMRSVTAAVNLSTGLVHPSDKASAVWAFRILKKNGHSWDREEIHGWAMANGWRAKNARELADVAAGVLEGRRYRVGQRPWQSQVLAEWRKAATAT